MENKHNVETTYQDQIGEPVIYEYIFRLPIFLKIALILIILGLFLGPFLFYLLGGSGKKGIPDQIFMLIVFLPAIYNLIVYKKRYFFTNAGIYLLDKMKKGTKTETAPRMIVRWEDYNRYRKFVFGFVIFHKAPMHDFMDSIDDSEDKMHAGTGGVLSRVKPVYIFSNHEASSQVEYFFLSRNLLPKALG